ncbi:hypothetical protein GOODEAATRI_021462, partial [Goodea atripinnis]
LYDPSYISAGGRPDYRSDLLAIRFASFNPILDPWVYILCRKNLLLKGCGRLKSAITRAKDGRGDEKSWVGGRNTPPSLHSNYTSYASLRTASFRNDTGHPLSTKNTSFTDFAIRQAWEYDTAQVNIHPFSVESAATSGSGEEAAPHPGLDDKEQASLGRGGVVNVHRVDIVTCTFSTPSSSQSAKCF